MKTEIDFPDSIIVAIAERVIASIRPLLARKQEAPDTILTTDQLAEYLGVGKQRVYEAVSLKTIPYFKVGKNLRFRKSVIDRWIETLSVPASGSPSSPLRIAK